MPNTLDAPLPRPATTRPPTRRDAAGWVLSAATLLVLVIGVLVIRGVRGDATGPNPSPIVSGASERRAAPQEAGATKPRVIVAMPEEPTEADPPRLPATAERSGATTPDRR